MKSTVGAAASRNSSKACCREVLNTVLHTSSGQSGGCRRRKKPPRSGRPSLSPSTSRLLSRLQPRGSLSARALHNGGAGPRPATHGARDQPLSYRVRGQPPRLPTQGWSSSATCHRTGSTRRRSPRRRAPRRGPEIFCPRGPSCGPAVEPSPPATGTKAHSKTPLRTACLPHPLFLGGGDLSFSKAEV